MKSPELKNRATIALILMALRKGFREGDIADRPNALLQDWAIALEPDIAFIARVIDDGESTVSLDATSDHYSKSVEPNPLHSVCENQGWYFTNVRRSIVYPSDATRDSAVSFEKAPGGFLGLAGTVLSRCFSHGKQDSCLMFVWHSVPPRFANLLDSYARHIVDISVDILEFFEHDSSSHMESEADVHIGRSSIETVSSRLNKWIEENPSETSLPLLVIGDVSYSANQVVEEIEKRSNIGRMLINAIVESAVDDFIREPDDK